MESYKTIDIPESQSSSSLPSSDSQSTGSSTAKLDSSAHKKQKRKWRRRTIIVIGTSLVIAVGVALAIPLCIYGGCFSDAEDETPPIQTTQTTEPVTTPSTPSVTPPGHGTRTVTTRYGQIVGHEVDVRGQGRLEDTVVSYLGVPYAKPPVGPLRWRRPQEPKPWTTPYVADTLPNMCLQPTLVIRGTHPGWEKFDEDCLYMQIYTPKDESKGLYPVMVYLHGGGFAISGSIQYPGHWYAIRETIMVSINYRMGVFGFSSTDDPATDSNYGLWDMVRAITFVRDTIEAFGGDPNRITVFGESAGSSAITVFLLSPITRGLFQQAILQSGASNTVQDPNDGRNVTFMRLADQLGCSRPTNTEMMDCMREQPAEVITDTTVICPGCRGNGMVLDGPDGLIPMHPFEMRDLGWEMPIPLMAGTMKDESAWSTLGRCPTCLVRGMTRNMFKNNVANMVTMMSGGFTEEGAVEAINEAMLLTYSPWPFIDDGTLNKVHLTHIQSDRSFLGPTNIVLNEQCDSHPVCYQFVYDVKIILEHGEGLFPRWMGVPHGMELPFLFSWPSIQTAPVDVFIDTGNMTMPLGITFGDRDRWWSEYSIELWTNFAKYSDPTPDDQPLTPPEHSGPATWKELELKEGSRWYFHIDNEFPETDPTKSLLNYRALETAFQYNYGRHLARGLDLHHDMYRRGLWPVEEQDSTQLLEILAPENMEKFTRLRNRV